MHIAVVYVKTNKHFTIAMTDEGNDTVVVCRSTLEKRKTGFLLG